jgi:hypothetical protein
MATNKGWPPQGQDQSEPQTSNSGSGAAERHEPIYAAAAVAQAQKSKSLMAMRLTAQFRLESITSFVALYGECCFVIASSFQRLMSTNGGGQAPKNAEFILDKVLRTKL